MSNDRVDRDGRADETASRATKGSRNPQDTTASRLFDLRTIIGALFVLYGVILIIAGLFDTAAEISKAAGIRINIWLQVRRCSCSARCSCCGCGCGRSGSNTGRRRPSGTGCPTGRARPETDSSVTSEGRTRQGCPTGAAPAHRGVATMAAASGGAPACAHRPRRNQLWPSPSAVRSSSSPRSSRRPRWRCSSAEFELRSVDGADRSALLPAVADVDAVLIRSATGIDAEALARGRLQGRRAGGRRARQRRRQAATQGGVIVVNAPERRTSSAR